MNCYPAEDTAWATAQMQDHISYTGWLSAMAIGSALWALMLGMVI